MNKRLPGTVSAFAPFSLGGKGTPCPAARRVFSYGDHYETALRESRTGSDMCSLAQLAVLTVDILTASVTWFGTPLLAAHHQEGGATLLKP